MTDERIARLNVLARKAKTEGLTEAEYTERAELRQEYLASIRMSLEGQLEHTLIMDQKGQLHKLKKREDPSEEENPV